MDTNYSVFVYSFSDTIDCYNTNNVMDLRLAFESLKSKFPLGNVISIDNRTGEILWMKIQISS